MTPDLLEAGGERLERYRNTESGGRSASLARPVVPGEVDVTHGRIL